MITSCKTLAAAGIALGLYLLPGIASAQPFGFWDDDRRYEESYITREPRRGYTGWTRGPWPGYFCDYQRIPIRRCDNGRCRAVAWETRQYCY
jgi:hypothetical protein